MTSFFVRLPTFTFIPRPVRGYLGVLQGVHCPPCVLQGFIHPQWTVEMQTRAQGDPVSAGDCWCPHPLCVQVCWCVKCLTQPVSNLFSSPGSTRTEVEWYQTRSSSRPYRTVCISVWLLTSLPPLLHPTSFLPSSFVLTFLFLAAPLFDLSSFLPSPCYTPLLSTLLWFKLLPSRKWGAVLFLSQRARWTELKWMNFYFCPTTKEGQEKCLSLKLQRDIRAPRRLSHSLPVHTSVRSVSLV